MQHHWLGLAFLCGLMTLPIAVAQDKAGKTDKDLLQGAWLVVSIEKEGKKIDVPKDKERTLTFTGDKAAFNHQNKTDEGAYKIDAAKKPKEIDLTDPKPDAKEMIKGIYQMDGDTMRIAFPAKPTGVRPTGFDAKEIVILDLKRKK